jgi:Holliday junction resolvase RusA-like endonuclease
MSFRVTVAGVPVPQGSKKAFAIKKGGAYTGSVAMSEMAKGHKSWRATVHAAAVAAREAEEGFEVLDGPLLMISSFWLLRPVSHPKTIYTLPSSKPDLSKLIRAVEDSLKTGGVIEDDARITEIISNKRYALPEHLKVLRSRYPDHWTEPGVEVILNRLDKQLVVRAGL